MSEKDAKERKIFKLSDEFIGHVGKLLSLTLATGTDIVYHLRQLRVEEVQTGEISVTPEYEKYIENLVNTMMKEVEQKLAAMDAADGTFLDD